MKTGIVYKLRMVGTDKFYIGSSLRIKQRLAAHMTQLRHGKHHCLPLQQLWDAGFRPELEILETVSAKNLRARETYHLRGADQDNLVNILLNGEGFGDALTRHPKRDELIETRRQSQLRNNATRSDAWREARAAAVRGVLNPMYGRTHTEEARRVMRDVNLGNQWAKGAVRSEATKARMSEVASRRTGEKNPFFGRHHSEATKATLRETNKGVLPTNARKFSAHGIVYESLTAAARALNVSAALLIYRTKSDKPKYAHFYYID